MRKLLILPGACDALGGTLVTLSLLIQGLKQCGMTEACRVLVQADSIMETYLRDAGQADCMQLISASTKQQFLQQALAWVNQQPTAHPLLLDNCVERPLLPALLKATPALRLSHRPIFHFCHDLALSHNYMGYLLRKLIFACLAPQAICNSQFTAQYIRALMPDIRGIMYQPVDTKRFHSNSSSVIPEPLQPILKSGAKMILTPSRINQARIINDKNLRALIPVLACLKQQDQHFHSVVIGEDRSPDQVNTKSLLIDAAMAGVGDRLTILPPVFAIEDYYRCADVVVTLAPREPFGRVVVEAISCGVPVIGSCTGGIGEILQHFAPEWTVDPDDPQAAAAAIMRVMADPQTSQHLLKGRQWVQSECSVTHYAQTMLNITGLSSSASPMTQQVAASGEPV